MNNTITTLGYGSLFKQKTKTNTAQPDFVGKIMVNGVNMNLAGWIKPTKTGEQYISVKVSEISRLFGAQSTAVVTGDDIFKPIKIEMAANDDLPF